MSDSVQFECLTDDEIVALAGWKGELWGSPLPSVRVSSPDDLQAAGVRGWRSLVLRGLLPQQGGVDPLAWFARLTGLPPTMMACVSNDKFMLLTSESAYLLHFPEGDGIAETVLPNGMHTFSRTSWELTVEFFSEMASTVYGTGLGKDRWLLLLGGAVDGERRGVAIAEQQIVTLRFETSGEIVAQGGVVGEPAAWDELVDALSGFRAGNSLKH